MARKPTETPRISVLDRRLQHPFGSPSRDIPLKGEKAGWAVRTFCADAEHPNRHYDAVHRLGWTTVSPDDLSVSVESLGFVVSADRRVVRGPQGQEVLMAMPMDMFLKIQRRKAEVNDKSLKPAAVRQEVSHATALAHGDQAGSMIHDHFSQQDVVETIEG
jgi:hypothetical protein